MGNKTTLVAKPEKRFGLVREDDQEFAWAIAMAENRCLAAARIYGLKGDPEQLKSFVASKISLKYMRAGIDAARMTLGEEYCLTRPEKRMKLAVYVREHDDPDVVIKAIQADNKMTGDEVSDTRASIVYVARVGDDVIDVTGSDDDCV